MAEQESLYLWSTTALTNESSDPAVNFAENQLPSTLNNSNRAVMAAIARFVKDTDGSLTTAGSANAYTLTINGRQTPLATGHRLSFKASFANTGAATLAVTNADAVALGTKAIRGPGDVALNAGQIISSGRYDVVYDTAANSAAGAWILLTGITGNVKIDTSTPLSEFPNYTFDVSNPTGHAGFYINSTTVAPDGSALVVQSTQSGAGISSGGAAYFGTLNNTTGAWDGYGTFHVLNTPNTQLTPTGVALWGTLRGERALGGTALDGTRSTNEMSYDAVVTFNTATEAVVWTNHALQVNDEVAFTTTGALPTGLVVDTKYFVKTILDANNFTLAATAGGALILLSGSPSATTTIHVYQNPARGLIVFNSTKYNAFNWGLQIPSAVQYGVQVGDVAFSATHIIPTHPFSFFNGDATPKELFFVKNDGTVNLKAASNVNTRFLNMKASNDADTAIMAISMQNASGTDKMLQWTDATSANYRFKSAGGVSFHTNSVVINAAGAAITLDTAQAVQFNAYGAGYIKSDASGNLTSSLTISGATIDGASNTITHAGKSALVLDVNRSGAQTPSAGAWVKVQLNNEVSDPNAWFDSSTNYRFQPNVAGVFMVTGMIQMNVGITSYGGISIYKNGTEYNKYIIASTTADTWQLTVPALVALNGSSDYIELFGFSSGASPSFVAGAQITKMNIYQLY